MMGLPHITLYLIESFPNRWLGRSGPIPWPLRSPDFTPLDYYLWGHMKTLVYETGIDLRVVKRDRIFAAADHIRKNIGSATQSRLMRAENCVAAGGVLLNHYCKAGTYHNI